MVCRYVGEDFVVIMTQMPCERTWQRELEAIRIPCDHTAIQMTFSGGKTELPQHGVEIENFLRHIDDLHYVARTEAGNCVGFRTAADTT